ncbi:unnamed protein product [Brachionus calyciflorus]|uniref:Uncharacterized protein n=1 Tax=Brachionus calyciflorus TaxID=104777 RepID=A0A813LXC1_9BILA|nr:unnamed protein product [Brachionus calyciflorus]
MSKEDLKLFDYYRDVKNSIDLEFEKWLLILEKDDIKQKELNLLRLKLIDQVELILKHNLKQFESKKDLNKFCFFIPNETENDLPGNLIITNQYISHNIRHNLGIRLDNSFEDELEMSPKEALLTALILNLIVNNGLNESPIIDLSQKDKNNLIKFNFQCLSDGLESNYFDDMDPFVDTSKILECFFDFSNLESLPEKIFVPFNNLNKFGLDLNENGLLSPNCFNGLNKLESIYIDNCLNEYLSEELISGLNGIKNFRIISSKIKTINKNAFKNSKELEEISFSGCALEEINAENFQNLEYLKILDLNDNRIETISKDVFQSLKNLNYLSLRYSLQTSLRADSLNVLENLEFLSIANDSVKHKWLNLEDLNLLKLKLISFDSNVIPKFKNLKSLRFMHVEELKILDKNEVVQYDLRGLAIDGPYNLIESIHKNIDGLKNLSHASFVLSNSNHQQFENIRNNINAFSSKLCKKDRVYTRFKNEIGSERRFEVSNYETFQEFFQKELDFSESMKDILEKYNHEYLYFK